MTNNHDSPLRKLRLTLPMPATLDDVAAWVRSYGLRCTAGHLSAIERGLKPPGPKLRAALALYYGMSPTRMAGILTRTLAARRKE